MTAKSGATTMEGHVFRSSAGRFFGWAWIVFAVANLVDIAVRGRDAESLFATAVLLLGTGIAYAVALRPRIVAGDTGVRLRNIVRDAWIPWTAVDRIAGPDAVNVHCHGRERPLRAWVLQTSPRSRAKFERRALREDKKMPDAVASCARGRTPTDFANERLTEMAEEHARRHRGDTPEPAVVTWAWAPILSLALPGLLFVISLVIVLA